MPDTVWHIYLAVKERPRSTAGECSPSLKPASEALPPGTGMPAASRQRGVGWRGGPLRTIKGADSGFRRTLCIPPRRAKRKAQVCGDSTVKSDGRRAGSPHPPLTRFPFPEKKEWRVKSGEWS